MMIIYSARTGTVRQIHETELLNAVREHRQALEALAEALRALKREQLRVCAVPAVPALVQSVTPAPQ